MKEEMSPQESLDIISAMIRQAKGNTQSNSFYFLLWGWVVALAHLGIFYLLTFTNYQRPEFIWLISIPAAFASVIYGYRGHRAARVSTPLDSTITWLWGAYAVTIFVIICFGKSVNFQIVPLILLFTGVATLLTGKLIKFNPLIVGGISIWSFGVAAFLLPYNYQSLIAGVAFSVGYIIPGHMLRKQKEL